MEHTEYTIVRRTPKPPHGNAKTGLPFYRMEVGESFFIPADDYGRTNSARAHFQKKHPGTKFSSSSIRDAEGKIIKYQFRRDS